MEPARGLNTQSAYEKRRFEINRVLMLKGIEIRDDGNFYKITKAESLSEVERRTRELKNKLSCYGAHQRVLICCREELLVDDYFHAVQEAVKGIVAPKDVLEAAKGKDVDIVLDMNGYKWTINGNNIQADNLKDINLAVDTDSDAIPDDVISELAGNNPVKQISLAYSGDFGFKASLTYNIGSEYAGKYGNLYYYDSTGRMIFQNAGAIDADGNISLNFSHASEYAVVIADYAVTTENADNTATGGIATGDSTPIALYAVLCVMAIALAGIAAVTRKKNV